MHNVPYCEAVGVLNWAMLTTHPDIMFAVTTMARFTANPGPAHWEAIKQIYCYLAGTCDLWLSYCCTRLGMAVLCNVLVACSVFSMLGIKSIRSF